MLLVPSHEIPPLMRRAHVIHGYRPTDQPRLYYLKSAFQLHNELVNVWTHAVPFTLQVFFYLLPEVFTHQRWPVLVLYSGIACLLAASALTHLMVSWFGIFKTLDFKTPATPDPLLKFQHSRSQKDHVFWLLVDFSGIAVFALCVGVQRWSCRVDSGHPLTSTLYLSSLLLVVAAQYLTTCGLFLFKPYWGARQLIRMGSCLLLAIWLYIPIAERYYHYHWAESVEADATLHLHSQAFLWLLASGVFMGANVPERLWPGRFDLFGYGHQLFHLCIAMVTWALVDAADLDCRVDLAGLGVVGQLQGYGGGAGNQSVPLSHREL